MDPSLHSEKDRNDFNFCNIERKKSHDWPKILRARFIASVQAFRNKFAASVSRKRPAVFPENLLEHDLYLDATSEYACCCNVCLEEFLLYSKTT